MSSNSQLDIMTTSKRLEKNVLSKNAGPGIVVRKFSASLYMKQLHKDINNVPPFMQCYTIKK